MKLSGVYAIIHIASGQAYVGSSKDIIGRWGGHVQNLQKGRHSSKRLLELWLVHGPSAFTFVVLEQCDVAQRQQLEQIWMDRFSQLLNASLSAHCAMLDPTVAAAMAQTKRLRGPTSSQREATARWMADPKWYDAALASASKRRGVPLSEEHRSKIAATCKIRGIPPAAVEAARRPKSPEHRKKIGEANRGKRHSEAAREKVAAYRRGRLLSAETKAKIGVAFRGRIQSPEHVAKRMAAFRRAILARRTHLFSAEERSL